MSDENKEKKNKKISKMSPAELDAALKKATDNKNSDLSKYVKHINQRKAELKNNLRLKERNRAPLAFCKHP